MLLHHSPETHQSLLTRIPEVTGRGLSAWFACLEAGPGLVRMEERVGWLRSEHDLPHAYAQALVVEHDRRRHAARS